MILSFKNNILSFNNKIYNYKSIQQVTEPYLLLDTIATHLRNYITTDLRNPNFFQYNLDGNQFQINDGGNDMFDGGNYTAPWLIANTNYTTLNSIPIPPSIGYSTTASTLTDTNFYYVSLGYSTTPDRRPLTLLGTRSGVGNPIGFQKAGNIGADGGGFLDGSIIYSGESLSGFTTYAFYRQTYGQASDPAICDLYILLGHPNWDSVFGSINNFASTNRGIQGGFFYTSGPLTKNILAITTLLSRPTNQPIPLFDVQTVTQNYITRIKEVLNY